MIARPSIAVGLAAALVFAGCASVGDGVDPAPTTTSVPPAPVEDPDPRPFLLTAGISYMPVWFRQPTDLPSVSVWRDGRVVLVDLVVVDEDDARYEVGTLRLGDAAIERIDAAVAAAGLVAAGDRGQVLARSVVDGGATILATRHGDERSVVVIDQPGYDEHPDSPRREYEAVLTVLRNEIDAAGGPVPVALDRWLVAVGPGDEPRGPITFDGRRIAGSARAIRRAAWDQTDVDGWCAVVTMDPLPLARQDQSVRLDGRRVTARPLLPGETDCSAGSTLAALLAHGPLVARDD